MISFWGMGSKLAMDSDGMSMRGQALTDAATVSRVHSQLIIDAAVESPLPILANLLTMQMQCWSKMRWCLFRITTGRSASPGWVRAFQIRGTRMSEIDGANLGETGERWSNFGLVHTWGFKGYFGSSSSYRVHIVAGK